MTADASDASSRVEVVVSAVYTTLVLADALIVINVLTGGNLQRWAVRQCRAVYRAVVGPFEQEAEIRRAASWLVWEAMQVLEEAQR